ncbi:hypothetical protein C4572_03930 [Candidatus Parcubacteria bacterium]|nr:MAG: hypothetical protein C4572_03930 [Candidatus Parcubacteria bacterium]
MKNFSLIVIIIGLAIILFFSAMVWKINQPSNNYCSDQLDTGCWKTFKNELYGLEFKYPEKYADSKNYNLWLINEGVLNLKTEWGVNKNQETIFSISVYEKSERQKVIDHFNLKPSKKKVFLNENLSGYSILNDFGYLIDKDNYIYIIRSSFIAAKHLNDDAQESRQIINNLKIF